MVICWVAVEVRVIPINIYSFILVSTFSFSFTISEKFVQLFGTETPEIP